MFSTVDSPRARFLRINLLTNGRAVPVMIPGWLSSEARRVRTMPHSDELRQLADSVAEGRWVPYRLLSPMYSYRMLSSTGPDSLDHHERVQRNHSLGNEVATPEQTDILDLTHLNILRMLKSEEVATNQIAGILPDSVSVEVWQYGFNSPGLALRARRVLAVTVARRVDQ